MTKTLPEELIRMVKLGKNIYFHQEDICRILEIIYDGCDSLSSKARVKQAIEVFSCIVDPVNPNPE